MASSTNRPSSKRPRSAGSPSTRAAPAFEPRFTLSVLYLAFFFFVWALILVLPEMLEALSRLAPGDDPEAAGKAAAQSAAQGRLWIALALSLASTALGTHFGVLPGTRR